MTDLDADRARKRRNLMLALSIGAFVVLVFLVTIVRMKAGVLERTF
jgi:predicted nucleic acid-binding Zn ribbon protein